MRHFHAKDEVTVLHLRHFFMCDVETELDHIPSLEKKFEERRCEPPIDLHILRELYIVLRRQTTYHVSLQAALSEIDPSSFAVDGKKKPAALKAVDQMDATELKKYYLLQQINDFEKCYLRLRNYVLYHCFSFPNELHADTPRDDTDRVIWSNLSDEVVGLDHIEVGHRLGVLEYSSPERYYLLNEAANIEMALQRYVSHLLSNDLNFKSFRNPDTCHDFLLKGIHLDGSEHGGFVLENSHYRLVGGASFPLFCAYKTGLSAHAKFMPEKFFTCGRKYVPPTNDTDRGLYTVRQRSNIQAFIATSSEEEIQTEYKRMLEWLITLYERLGLHFRVCNTRASALHRSESLRTTVQLYSAHRREFVDAAHVSFSGDYISQRLNILNHDKDENHHTTWLLDVAVLSVPTLVANFLEKSKTNIFVPECLVPYMYTSSRITS